MSMTLKTTKNMCCGLSVVFKITTRRSTIDVRKKSDLSRKNRTTGPPGHVRQISDQPRPVEAVTWLNLASNRVEEIFPDFRKQLFPFLGIIFMWWCFIVWIHWFMWDIYGIFGQEMPPGFTRFVTLQFCLFGKVHGQANLSEKTLKILLWIDIPGLSRKVVRGLDYIEGLVQGRCNSIANALELRLSCINLSICPHQPKLCWIHKQNFHDGSCKQMMLGSFWYLQTSLDLIFFQ